MRTTRFFAMLLPAAIGILSLAPPAWSDANPLDGKRFEGVFLAKGKTSGDADTLIFADGKFRSTACDRYGYSDAPYKATVEGDAIKFEAETTSQKYGKLQWKGVVRGDKLDATAMMLQPGKAPVENWIVAGIKK